MWIFEFHCHCVYSVLSSYTIVYRYCIYVVMICICIKCGGAKYVDIRITLHYGICYVLYVIYVIVQLYYMSL